jgi:hypothetical protein
VTALCVVGVEYRDATRAPARLEINDARAKRRRWVARAVRVRLQRCAGARRRASKRLFVLCGAATLQGLLGLCLRLRLRPSFEFTRRASRLRYCADDGAGALVNTFLLLAASASRRTGAGTAALVAFGSYRARAG